MLHHLENSEKKHILQFITHTHTLSLPVVRSGIELMGCLGQTGVFMAADDRSMVTIISRHSMTSAFTTLFTPGCVSISGCVIHMQADEFLIRLTTQ